MARLVRVVAVCEPHHLTQRGNNRQTTFLDDHDRRTYCRLLAEHSKRAGIRVLGYCLMTNHIHLVAIPERADSFARGLLCRRLSCLTSSFCPLFAPESHHRINA